MSAAVCGKRSFFEESPSRLVSKRARWSSSSPPRVSPSRSASGSTNVDHLVTLFPDVNKELLAQALGECGDDLDLAIKKLEELQFGCENNNMGADASPFNHPPTPANTEVSTDQQQDANPKDPSPSENLPKDGAEWVELFVREMTSATNMDDARARAARALEFFEKSLVARVSVEAAQNVQQENTMLKEQAQVLIHENATLKKAVVIQHERQKEFDSRSQELQNLKQLIPQYQEELRKLGLENYTLSVHLKRAQESHSIPGRFHPDIF